MKSKAENLFLVLFLLLIPTQLGRHFWPEWSYVQGLRIDYLSPTLYLIDLVWIGVFSLKVLKSKSLKVKVDWRWIVLVVVNIWVAGSKWVAIYRWIRWWQWWETVKIIQRSKIKYQKYLTVIIPVWIALESLLELAQVSRGRSLQGIFYWLGERRLTLSTPGIAQMSWLGEELLRAYGTFSHPNSLAGFLLVAGLVWLTMIKEKKLTITRWAIMWLLTVGIVLTGSRVVWLLSGILVLGYLKRKTNWVFLGLGGILVGGTMLAVNQNYRLGDYFGGWDRESWTKRWNLDLAAGKTIRDNPPLGVGMGNFLVRLPEYQEGRRYLQPVHNIALLWIAETGIVGGVLWGWWILNQISNIKNQKFKEVLLVILATGMVDHYWMTLSQNMWLLAVVVGLFSQGLYLRDVREADN